MLIYSFITDYQAFNLRYKDNTTRDKNETKVDKQSANLGKNNEPIQNRLSFLIDCKSVILHHLAILSFPMVRPAWDNWWLLVDHLLLDGYKVMFGEYEVNSVICFEEWMPEHLIEPATVKLQAGRKLQDGAKVFLNHDMTYSIVESGNTISSGTYEMGIYEVAPAEWSCYYYPGPCSFMGYLTLTDSNGVRNGFGMQVATHQDSSKDYGTPQVYQGFEINEDDMSYLYGIRYGLTYCE